MKSGNRWAWLMVVGMEYLTVDSSEWRTVVWMDYQKESGRVFQSEEEMVDCLVGRKALKLEFGWVVTTAWQLELLSVAERVDLMGSRMAASLAVQSVLRLANLMVGMLAVC